MTFFKQKTLSEAVSEKYRRLSLGELAEFTVEEAAFAGAFLEDAIGFEDVDHYEAGDRHEH